MRLIICIPKIENRGVLASLKNNPAVGTGINVVYVYHLLGERISYPKGRSNVLYIGEAMRKSEATGVRFRQHITPSAEEGADTGNNFTLSQYFHAGWNVGLSIFATDMNRADRERDLIYAHISLYGAPPIAQGKIPHDANGRNRTTHIASFIANNKQAINVASQVLTKIVADHDLTSSCAGRAEARR